MPEPESTSLDLMAAKTLAQLKKTDILYIADPDESAPVDFNRQVSVKVLGRYLGGLVYDFSIASGSKAAVSIAFGETLSPTPDKAGVLCAYQAAAETVVGVEIVPGSLSATGCQVRAKSDNHTGIAGTVVVR